MALRSSLGYLILPLWGVGIDGSLNEARWSFAPTGRKGIAQGKAKRRPGIRYASIIASPERAEPAAHKSTHMFRPFRAWANWGDGVPRSPVYPGWRCALPWAISFCPFGAWGSIEYEGRLTLGRTFRSNLFVFRLEGHEAIEPSLNHQFLLLRRGEVHRDVNLFASSRFIARSVQAHAQD